jgi:hypothetical protein
MFVLHPNAQRSAAAPQRICGRTGDGRQRGARLPHTKSRCRQQRTVRARLRLVYGQHLTRTTTYRDGYLFHNHHHSSVPVPLSRVGLIRCPEGTSPSGTLVHGPPRPAPLYALSKAIVAVSTPLL